MRLSEWVQALALLVVAVALSWTLAIGVNFWPAGLALFGVLLFVLALLVEWKSGGGDL